MEMAVTEAPRVPHLEQRMRAPTASRDALGPHRRPSASGSRALLPALAPNADEKLAEGIVDLLDVRQGPHAERFRYCRRRSMQYLRRLTTG